MARQFPISIVDPTTKAPASVEADGSLNVKVTDMPASGEIDTVSVGINILSATTTTVVSANATQKIKIVGIMLFSSGVNIITIKRGSTALCGPFDLTEQTGFSLSIGNNIPLCETAINEAFNITTSSSAQLSGFVVYFLEE